jgi:hypothetical protein
MARRKSVADATTTGIGNLFWTWETMLWEMGALTYKPPSHPPEFYVPQFNENTPIIPGCRCRNCKWVELDGERNPIACDNAESPVNFIDPEHDFGCILGRRSEDVANILKGAK